MVCTTWLFRRCWKLRLGDHYPPPFLLRNRTFGLSLSYCDARSCVDSRGGAPRNALVASDWLQDLLIHRCWGKKMNKETISGGGEIGGLPEYHHDLVGQLSVWHILLVV